MHHAVAVERVIAAGDGLEQGVLRVAEIDSFQIARDLSVDQIELGGIELHRVRRPCAGTVRMEIRVTELRLVPADNGNLHGGLSPDACGACMVVASVHAGCGVLQ